MFTLITCSASCEHALSDRLSGTCVTSLVVDLHEKVKSFEMNRNKLVFPRWLIRLLCFVPSVLEYVVNLDQDSGVVSVSTVQIPFGLRGNPFNHCFMVTIAVLIASEGLPWAEQMVAYSFFSVFLPVRDEEGGHAQSHPAWKNRPLPQKDKGPFWPHYCREGCNRVARERGREGRRQAAVRGKPLLPPVEIT